MFGLADRSDPPGSITATPPTIRADREGFIANLQGVGPAAGLGEAQGIEEHTAVFADVLARLLEGGDGTLPGEVHRDAMRVLVE